MNTRRATVLVLAGVGLGVLATVGFLNRGTAARAGADPKAAVVLPSEKPIMEGPLQSAAYEREDGKIGGCTRADNPQAVLGGSGSWNEYRYGRLYRDHLDVTRPSDPKWGALVIPASRGRSLHFAEE
jgi:hypothetical protein